MKTKYNNPSDLIRRSFSTMMSFEELQQSIEIILSRDPQLNGLVMERPETPPLDQSTLAIHLIGLNPNGGIEIKYRALKGNNLVCFEYFKYDESISDLLIKFLGETLTEVLGLEIKYSTVDFLQDLKGMDISKHIIITDAAINSARHCEFSDYEKIEKDIPKFFNMDSLRKWSFKLVSQENPDWRGNRIILFNNIKTELPYQHIIYSKNERMFFRFLYAVDTSLSKFIIGRVDNYYPMPF